MDLIDGTKTFEWFVGDVVWGTACSVYEGNDDPHKGRFICDCEPLADIEIGGTLNPQLNAQWIASQHNRLYRLMAAIEELDRRMNEDQTFLTVTEGDEEIIKFYNIPCGPWHRILGIARG